ncbi:hypothetical protein F511_34798 [Dorcoceras hygrometricum]|uniref:Uncharacterized protein n=1 Tax=Dorcoceras hygrometricum TaxID=472368 RepID=A0A2Z7CEU0_9LAMI|nr:hypothetical protein F511_34798 [Dorcoceras hygrometricum]
MESAAGLAMETSKVVSAVRNQAEAKLNQLEHKAIYAKATPLKKVDEKTLICLRCSSGEFLDVQEQEVLHLQFDVAARNYLKSFKCAAADLLILIFGPTIGIRAGAESLKNTIHKICFWKFGPQCPTSPLLPPRKAPLEDFDGYRTSANTHPHKQHLYGLLDSTSPRLFTWNLFYVSVQRLHTHEFYVIVLGRKLIVNWF